MKTGLINSENFAKRVCFQRGVFPLFLNADIPVAVNAGCVNALLLPTDSCSVFLITLSNLPLAPRQLRPESSTTQNDSATWESGSHLHIFVIGKADAYLG